jgi:glutamyl-tRNA synthetase
MIRVRFAPSPTGNLHIGGARTAVFNWIFAKANQGAFILRIEDTDMLRSKKEFLTEIEDSLRWLGFEWQEEHFQSQRLEIYRQHAKQLLDKGLAYEQVSNKEGVSGKALIFKVPQEKKVTIKDFVYGPIEFDTSEIKDQVLIKSDGMPAYNFACVVDDHLMNITHIIRGDDHLSNTPKQIMFYEAFSWQLPYFAHLPLILGKGGGRLSKRTGATAISEFRNMGFLPEAIFNYLLLLSWSPGENKELVSSAEAIKKFKLEAVNKTAATFDMDKLLWMNNQYLKNADADELIGILTPSLEGKGYTPKSLDKKWLKEVVKLFQGRINTLNDFAEWANFFFVDQVSFDEAALNKLKERGCKNDFQALAKRFSALKDFTGQETEKVFRDYIAENNIPSRELIHPLRAALTGKTIGPSLFELISVLGKEKVVQRLERLSK